MRTKMSVEVEAFPIKGAFVIARGAKTQAVVVSVILRQGEAVGRGECTPYARYGETPESVVDAIESLRGAIEAGVDQNQLQSLLPAGAARNALDCALWDLEAKRSGVPVWRRAGLERPAPLTTAFTLSVGAPDDMRKAAEASATRPLLKIKLAGEGDAARLLAVREGAPEARLIVDANEAWREENLFANIEACAKAGVALIEQPLPAGADAILASFAHKVPICADESAHERSGLSALKGRYGAVNVKLDKTGGFSEALATVREARRLGLKVMVGCMVSTSLAMAPAALVAQMADFVDLDGPLLLAEDRDPPLRYEGSTLYPPQPDMWG